MGSNVGDFSDHDGLLGGEVLGDHDLQLPNEVHTLDHFVPFATSTVGIKGVLDGLDSVDSHVLRGDLDLVDVLLKGK